MTAPNIHDPFATIDPLIVFMDAHRLLLLAIREIEGEHLDAALADRGTVRDAIERVRARDTSVVVALRAVAGDDRDGAQRHLAIAMSDDPRSESDRDATDVISSMHDAHEAFMEAYGMFDLARLDEVIAITDGTITLRHLLIEHAMREGAEAYAIAATLGRTID
ncbi:MAG: hypothetical protein AMXMBFR23_24190 [Chloroflexota bacterium]